MMDAKSKIDPGLCKMERKLKNPKFSVVTEGSVSYLQAACEGHIYKMVSESKSPEELKQELDSLNGDLSPLDDTIVTSEQTTDDDPKWHSGDKVTTLIGNFQVVTLDEDDIILVDQNSQTIVLSLSDFEDLDPVISQEPPPENSPLPVSATSAPPDNTPKEPAPQNEEATQVGDVPTPTGTVGRKLFATYYDLRDDGELEEKTVEADTAEELKAKILKAEKNPNFVELGSIDDLNANEGNLQAPPTGPNLLYSDLDINGDAKAIMNEEDITPGTYDSDMGPITVHGKEKGHFRVSLDDETMNMDPTELLSLNITSAQALSKQEEDEEDSPENLLRDLNESTGIKGVLSKDGRYVRIEGGRLRAKAFLESRDLREYVSLAKSGILNGTKSFRWRG